MVVKLAMTKTDLVALCRSDTLRGSRAGPRAQLAVGSGSGVVAVPSCNPEDRGNRLGADTGLTPKLVDEECLQMPG